jgi:hypothetical protein
VQRFFVLFSKKFSPGEPRHPNYAIANFSGLFLSLFDRANKISPLPNILLVFALKLMMKPRHSPV